MKYIDMHCDTLMIYASKDKNDLYENNKSVDIKRLKKAGAIAQFFAIWMPDKETIIKEIERRAGEKRAEAFMWEKYSDDMYFDALYQGFLECMENYSSVISHVSDYKGYLQNTHSGKISAFLTVEDGRVIGGKLSNIDELKKRGVSLITLTWNYKNCIGSPNSFEKSTMNEGLTVFGKEAVEYMQDKGILVDVSHLSDGGFNDVADICRKPFVASHSNARALSPHPRNLTDDMIRVIGRKGGIIGLNFCPDFLNEDINDKNSTVERLCVHALHMADKGGIETVALGSDLDGIEGNIEINSTDKMELLYYGLKHIGFKESELDKILFKNVERIIKNIL